MGLSEIRSTSEPEELRRRGQFGQLPSFRMQWIPFFQVALVVGVLIIAALRFVALKQRLASLQNRPAKTLTAIKEADDGSEADESGSRCICLNLQASPKGLSEFDEGRRIIFIPKDQVRSVELRFGIQAERPVLQASAGLALVGLGIAGALLLETGGLPGLRWGLGALVFGGLGVWLVWEAIKKGHYLVVEGPQGQRRLHFKGRPQESELSDFIRKAAPLGYLIRDVTGQPVVRQVLGS